MDVLCQYGVIGSKLIEPFFNIQAHTYTHTHTYIHTYIHTNIHTYTYTTFGKL